ncbi:MAG: hypothetical protein NTU51_09515 [Bacteroidetes bacterium]|nr:hypothetical protein [Bacteroidota bacterium]
MGKRYFLIIVLALLLIHWNAYPQERNKQAEKYADFYCRMLANSCSMAPKNLTIQLQKSICNTNLKLGWAGWRIWARIAWRGQVSRMNYNVNVYIEVNEPVNGRSGSTTFFFLDYSYLLGFRCIKDEKTKPARLLNGKIKFCRYREFDYVRF